MGIETWLRGKVRFGIDRLFCSSAPGIQRVGDAETGWVIDTGAKAQICYCAGVGNSMTFELDFGV
jgi:hypothetical protein